MQEPTLKLFPLQETGQYHSLSDVVPKALGEGYKLASIPSIAQALLDGNLHFRDDHISGDVVLQHYQKGVKLVRGNELFWKKIHAQAVNPKGSIVFEEELYDSVEGATFSVEQLTNEYLGTIWGKRPMKKNEIVGCPLWREAFYDDIPLLEAFAEESFRQLETSCQEEYGKSLPADIKWMGVKVKPAHQNYQYPLVSQWSLGSVEFSFMLDTWSDYRCTSSSNKLVGISQQQKC